MKAKIRKIQLSIGRTLNKGNFESFRVDVELGAQVADGDDIDKIHAELREKAYELLNYEIDNEG